MKLIAIYWIVGCLLIGSGVGSNKNRCPNDKGPSAQEIFFAVVEWPALLAMVVTWNSGPATCDRLP